MHESIVFMDKSPVMMGREVSGEMEDQAYYRYGIIQPRDADCCDEAVPLLVNCAGYVSMERVFWTSGCRHDYYLQILDTGELICENDGVVMHPGEFIVHPPERAYGYGVTDACEMGYYWAHFTGSHAALLLESCGIVPGRIYRSGDELSATVRRGFVEIFHEFLMHGCGYEELCAAKLTELLVELGRSVSGGCRMGRFSGLIEYIHRHYTEELCIAELAESEHLSVSRFRELFRRTFGCAPSEYIIGLRIRHACDLLSTTDLSISEIAELCGYGDELYFMRLFRKKLGCSARAYRMEHNSADIGRDT